MKNTKKEVDLMIGLVDPRTKAKRYRVPNLLILDQDAQKKQMLLFAGENSKENPGGRAGKR